MLEICSVSLHRGIDHVHKAHCVCISGFFCACFHIRVKLQRSGLEIIHLYIKCISMFTGRGGAVCICEIFLYLACVCMSVWVCVHQCGGWGWRWVFVFVCQINYLNPPTIKAEICYQRPPLETCASALLPQYAPCLFPLSVLSMGLDKDHKLGILNTHPSRTKANSVFVTQGLMHTPNVSIIGVYE